MGGRQADAGSVTYKIIITPTAMELLHAIPDRRVQKTIAARIDRLAKEPRNRANHYWENWQAIGASAPSGSDIGLFTGWTGDRPSS